MSALERINSRPPTGKVGHPLILIEGEEKAGKTYLAYLLTASDRVGRCFAIDLGEGSADEYAPIGDYEVIEHDGTFGSVLDQVKAIHEFAREQLEAGEKPVVLTIDTMSDEWGVLVDGITAKASRSEANRRKLADDPAAEIKVPNHLWNDANAKHRRLMTLLLTFPGIVLITARGKEVAEIRNGSPVEGSKVWKVEGQKNLAFDVTAWIRMKRNDDPTLEGCRNIYVGLRPGVDAARNLRANGSEWDERGLEWFIFDAMRYDPAVAHARDLRAMTDDGEGIDDSPSPELVHHFAANIVRPAWDDAEALAAAYRDLVARGLYDAPVTTTDGQQTTLGELVRGRGQQLAVAANETASPARQALEEHADEGAAREYADEAPTPAVDEPAAAPEDDDPVRRILDLLDVAQSAADMRAAWALSGELGVRAAEVEYPQHGQIRLGTLIQRIGQTFPDANDQRVADHAERAAGEAATVGQR